jgi:hypothetical protein
LEGWLTMTPRRSPMPLAAAIVVRLLVRDRITIADIEAARAAH